MFEDNSAPLPGSISISNVSSVSAKGKSISISYIPFVPNSKFVCLSISEVVFVSLYVNFAFGSPDITNFFSVLKNVTFDLSIEIEDIFFFTTGNSLAITLIS